MADVGDDHTAPDNEKELIMGLKPIGGGTYTLEWHAVSVATRISDIRFSLSEAP